MSMGTRALRPAAAIGVLLLLATSCMVEAADNAVWAALRTSGAVVGRASTFVTTGIAGSLKFNTARSSASRSCAGFMSAQ